jgi:preflagellin peptidase FlaK
MLTIDTTTTASFILSIIFLSCSAYSDFKTREVSDILWIIYLPLSAVLLISRLLLDPRLMPVSIMSIAATSTLSLIMFYTGVFGGADAKAFICLSIALPTNPLRKPPFLQLNPIFPITVLYTTYFLSASTIVYVFSRNILWKYFKRKKLFENIEEPSTLKKMLAVLTGYKIDHDTLRKKVHLYPIEEAFVQDGITHRRLRLSARAEIDRDDVARTSENLLASSQEGDVWVTPGIPLLLFALLALVVNGFFGDIFMWIIFEILSSIF